MKIPQVLRSLSPVIGRTGRRKPRLGWLRQMLGLIRPAARFGCILALFAGMVALAIWWRGAALDVMAAPGRVSLDAVTVHLTKNRQVVALSRKDLGQPPGPSSFDEFDQLEFSFSHDGIFLLNKSHAKRLDLKYAKDGFEASTEHLLIPKGKTSRLLVDGGRLTFSAVTAQGFDLEASAPEGSAARRFRYDSAAGWSPRLERIDEGSWGKDCNNPTSWRGRFNDFTFAMQGFLRKLHLWRIRDFDVATLGGERDCADDWRRQIGGLGSLPWRSLKIVRRGDEFFLTPFDPSARGATRFALVSSPTDAPNPHPARVDFVTQTLRIDDEKGPHGRLEKFIAGRTTYEVATKPNADGVDVILQPKEKIPLIDPQVCGPTVDADDRQHAGCPEGVLSDPGNSGPVTWIWTRPYNSLGAVGGVASLVALDLKERLLRYGFGAIAVLLSGWLTGVWGAAARLVKRQSLAASAPTAQAAFAFACFSVALMLAPEIAGLLHLTGLSASWAFQITLFNWLLAGMLLLAAQGGGIALGLMWIAVMTLAAVGSIALASMAEDGDTTNWAQYFIRQKLLFLDLLPPFVVTFAGCPLRALNPALRELVWSTNLRYLAIRFVPSLGLLGAFAAWAAFGTQTGFGGGFQPAEAGKFASILLAATVLLRMDPNSGPASYGTRRLFSALWPAFLLAVFIAALVFVPFFKSDWGPALIMGLLLSGLLLSFIMPLSAQAIGVWWRRQQQRDRAPLAFRPRMPVARAAGAIRGLLILVAVAACVLLSPLGWSTGTTLALGMKNWGANEAETLFRLEREGLGGHRRLVAERFITWTDLGYGKPPWPNCQQPDKYGPSMDDKGQVAGELKPRSCYRDIEWQVVRSRQIVAGAPCGLAGPAAPNERVGFLRPVADAFASWMAAPCGALENAMPGPATLQLSGPIAIPVVQNDFAAAYLFGRLGAGAAALFYGAQALLIMVAFWAYMRITGTRRGSRLEVGARRFLAVVLAGSALLFVLQWTLSWSNVLGLLPVVGQPMTMLSYAVSHHLFAALPCLLAMVVGLRFASVDRPVFMARSAPRSARSLF